jgi:hypothetical protein
MQSGMTITMNTASRLRFARSTSAQTASMRASAACVGWSGDDGRCLRSGRGRLHLPPSHPRQLMESGMRRRSGSVDDDDGLSVMVPRNDKALARVSAPCAVPRRYMGGATFPPRSG